MSRLHLTFENQEELARVVQHPFARHLRSLDLSETGGEPCTETGAAALVTSPYLTSLEELGLRRAYLGGPGANTLRSASFLGRLTRLVVNDPTLDEYPTGRRQLLAALTPDVMRHLEVGGVRHGPAAVRHLILRAAAAHRAADGSPGTTL